MSSTDQHLDLDLGAVIDAGAAFVTTEYASLTAAGAPITWPVTPYRGTAGTTIDVTTGLTYPLKAERARRNPKVALSFSFPVGSGLADPATFVVLGTAAVRDADLTAGSARYLREARAKFPEAFGKVPAALLSRMAFYWTRIWVEVTPAEVLWWEAGDLGRPPQRWQFPDAVPGVSDPAPAGRGAGSWSSEPPADWRRRAAGALDRLGLPVITTVTADGWPLPLRVREARATDDGFVVVPPAGVEIADGPAFLTFHRHAEVFDSQENIGLAGHATPAGDEVHLRVDRALSDWGVQRNPVRNMLAMLRAGRRLRPRLVDEAARRGQRPPSFDDVRRRA